MGIVNGINHQQMKNNNNNPKFKIKFIGQVKESLVSDESKQRKRVQSL